MRTIEEVFSDEFSESEEKSLTEIAKRYIKDAMRQYAKEVVIEDRKNIAEHLWNFADKDSIINAPKTELK